MDAAYTLYEILKILVERVGWPSEAEKMRVLESISEAERVSLFGNMQQIIVCKHTATRSVSVGSGWATVCSDCGKRL